MIHLRPVVRYRASGLLPMLLTCFAALTSVGIAQEAAVSAPFLGKWDITGEGAGAGHVYWLEVGTENGRLVGTFMNRRGALVRLPEIAIVDGELVFSVGPRPNGRKQVHRARVEEGRLLGRMGEEAPGGASADDSADMPPDIPWIGMRPPQWGEHNANARHRLGTPVRLFNGENLENWLRQDPERPIGWTVVDGVMTNEARANNLISRHRFEDFRIRCEYRIEEKSNSGIFLRGRYELQIVDDFGQPPGSQGHMALYSRLTPSINASLPAGQWQVMEATFVGNRLTVDLNGKRIIDNAIVEGITGGALDSNEGAPGPIMIQGDHGRVAFRRIVVTPIINLKQVN